MWSHFLINTVAVLLNTQVFHGMDTVIVQAGLRKPYYGVHVVHNILIMLLTYADVWNSFAQFTTLHLHEPNYAAASLCYSLHFYHIMYYWRSFRYDDWLHHGLMIGIALPLSSQLTTGPLLGSNLFFTTGLPGAISYGLLFANRNGWIESRPTKRWNAATNLWLRAPGCVMHATLSILAIFTMPRVSTDHAIATAFIAVLMAWNGLYFMEQAVRANAVAQDAPPPHRDD